MTHIEPKIPAANPTKKLKLQLRLKRAKQRPATGFALAIVLFTLVITAMLSAAAIKMGMFEQRVVRTQTDIMQAKNNAELTLIDAMDNILCSETVAGTGTPIANNGNFYGNPPSIIADNTCESGTCGRITNNATPLWQNLADSTLNVGFFAKYGQFTGKTAIASNKGRYIIEIVQTNFPTGMGGANLGATPENQYRITAVGFANNNDSVSHTVQALFRAKNQVCPYNVQSSNPF